MSLLGPPAQNSEKSYHIFVYGKYQQPAFQMCKVAAEHLAKTQKEVESTVQGCFETEFESHVRFNVRKYGGAFVRAKLMQPLVFAHTEDSVLFFVDENLFMEWCKKRFDYEDHTSSIFYRHIGLKSYQAVKDKSGRSYASLNFAIGEEQKETVQLELFDEECPELVGNFLDLLTNPKFDGHLVHRVKAGAWVQGGDLVDGSGQHSEAAKGGFLRHESFVIPHDRPGLIGMANHGKDTNGSQYYITLKELPFLDGRSVIFGRVISGMRAIMKINKLATKNERPLQAVTVTVAEFSIGAIQKQCRETLQAQ